LKEEKSLNIALNKISGEWNEESLADLLKELGTDPLIDYTGFDDKEILKLLLKTGRIEIPEEDNFDTQNAYENTKYEIHTGDLYELGNHKLLCGDATKKEDYMKLMGSERADMIFTDPPYNVNYRGSKDKKGTFQNENQTKKEFQEWLSKATINTYEFSKDNSPIFYCTSALKIREFINAIEKATYKITNVIIWKKDRTTYRVGNKSCYKWGYEPLIFAIKEKVPNTYYEIYTSTNVWEIDAPISFGKRETGKTKEDTGIHPTSKPTKLSSKAIINHTKEKQIILDPFGGSGSTLISAEQNNRKCRMIEIDKKYCSAILQRWEELTGKKAKLL